MSSRRRDVVLGAVGLLAFLLLWESVRIVGLLSPRDIGFPSTIARAFPAVSSSPEFIDASIVSARQFFGGCAIGLTAGMVLALWFGLKPRLGEFFDLLMTAGYAVPMIALVPVFILLFGIGDQTATIIVANFSFFPLYFVVHGAIASVDPKLVRMCRAFGGRGTDIVTGIMLPSIVPAVVSGARLGVGRALIGLVVTELYLGTGGLGNFIMVAINQGDQAAAFVAISAIAVANLVLTETIGALEKRFERWRPA